jgi:14-3-3 protein
METASAVAPASNDPALKILDLVEYSRKNAQYLAFLAESSGRYSDMREVIRMMAKEESKKGNVLTEEERALISIAYKNCLSSYRGTLKLLGLLQDVPNLTNPQQDGLTLYGVQAEAHILAISRELTSLLLETQIPLCEQVLEKLDHEEAAATETSSSSTGGSSSKTATKVQCLETLVFCFKLCGDYSRYVSECHSEKSVILEFSDLALRFYSKARGLTMSYFHPASSFALGVGLNLSVFLFEVRHCEEEACEVASVCLADAMKYLEKSQSDDDEKDVASSNSSNESDKLSIGEPVTDSMKADANAICVVIKNNIAVWNQILSVKTLVV